MGSKLLLILVAGVTACGGSSTVTAPAPSSQTPTPIPTTPAGWTASGVVSEWTKRGERPLADVDVNAWIETPGYGYSYWYRNGRRKTDAQGRYQLTDVPAGASFQLQVAKDGYAPQCAPPPVTVNGDFQLNAKLIPRTSLAITPDSAPPADAGFRLIFGVVYQPGAEGRRTVSDAYVDYEPSPESPAAWTWTDAQGRFLLCGIPQARTVAIAAALNERIGYLSVPPGADATVEIDLR